MRKAPAKPTLQKGGSFRVGSVSAVEVSTLSSRQVLERGQKGDAEISSKMKVACPYRALLSVEMMAEKDDS